MKYLLHGDDTTASRNYLSELSQGLLTVTLDGKTISKKTLEENLVSTSLFGDKRIVVIENLLSKNPKKKELAGFLAVTKTTEMIVLLEDKKLAKTSLSLVKDATAKEFSLPAFYFQFLDSLAPKQGKRVFSLYQSLLSSYAPEQLLFSLIKRVRQLVFLSAGTASQELSAMSSWQLSKLQEQLRAWDKNMLKKFYEELKNTEIKLKTGNLPTSLSKYLDILILSKLT